MKNKKGFTLIELLVTIALVLSVLGIAIVSFINLSNKKKEEAWEKVKEQTELAAEEYFETYKYYLESLNDNNSYARVSIGKLVEEDFLNKVTDPRSGKSVNECDYVEVTLSSSGTKYIYTYKTNEDNVSCNVNSYVIVSEVGAPGISLKFYKSNDIEKKKIRADAETGWYNNSVLGDNTLAVNVIGKTNGNGKIIGIRWCEANGSMSCINYDDNNAINGSTYDDISTFALDTNEKTACYKVTNVSGKSASECVTAKVDTVAPTINLIAKLDTIENIKSYERTLNDDELSRITKDYTSGEWTNEGIYFAFKKEDSGSGINGDITYCTDSRKVNTDYYKFYNYRRAYETSDFIIECSAVDKAGNKGENVSYKAKIDLVKPTCSIAFEGKEGWNGWFITENVSASLTKTDKNSGIKEFGLSLSENKTYNSKSQGTQTNETSGTTWYGYVKDLAGNENICSSVVKLEKEVTISFDKTNTNNSNSTKSHNGKIFNKEYIGTCGYGECSDIKCIGTNEKRVDKDYFARACMDVYSYPRYFYVSSVSTGNNKSVKVTDLVDKDYNNINTPGMKRTTTLSRYDCKNDWGSDYKYNECGGQSGSKNDFSAHVYKYVSESGLQSNAIRLYTEYRIDCKY